MVLLLIRFCLTEFLRLSAQLFFQFCLFLFCGHSFLAQVALQFSLRVQLFAQLHVVSHQMRALGHQVGYLLLYRAGRLRGILRLFIAHRPHRL